jgi:hypothetical protein
VEEALVEARDVDSRLSAINMQYDPDKKNVYKEDAFARLLMGILYEISGTASDKNDAFISYRKALAVYENDYQHNYDTDVPVILKENLLRAAGYMGRDEQKEYQKKLPGVNYPQSGQGGAEVYLIHYHGLSPIKIQSTFTAPLPGGLLGRIAFPQYKEREVGATSYVFKADQGRRVAAQGPTELAEDISAIAIANLENRKYRLIAKSAARSAGKYFLAKKQAENIGKKHGELAGDAALLAGSLYNIYSEQADIRSWQTLPGEVRIARLRVLPGVYQFYLNNDFLGEYDLQEGQKKMLIHRTTF